jgi:hypothetical protein
VNLVIDLNEIGQNSNHSRHTCQAVLYPLAKTSHLLRNPVIRILTSPSIDRTQYPAKADKYPLQVYYVQGAIHECEEMGCVEDFSKVVCAIQGDGDEGSNFSGVS